MSNTPNRLTHFDGLRGIAACIVFICHLLVAFYPATHSGAAEEAHTALNIESFLRNSPFNLLFNGKFAVCVFFGISGYVLSYHYFSNPDKRKVIGAMGKRYPRLMILVWMSVLISFGLQFLGVFDMGKTAAITQSPWLKELFKEHITFGALLKNIGYEQFLSENPSIPLNPVLWTIATELKGSFLVFIVLLIIPMNNWRYVVYAPVLIYFSHWHYALFMFGLILADISSTRKPVLHLPAWLWCLVVAMILVLGSYKPETPSVLWEWIGPAITFTNPIFLGAAALLFLTCYHPGVQGLLKKKPSLWLGTISYSLYICHLVAICVLICPLFYSIYSLTGHYHASAMASILIAFPVVFAISLYLFNPVDEWSIRVSNKIGKKITARISG